MDEMLAKAAEFKTLCNVRATAHFRMSELYSKFHLALGVPVTILSSVVATSIFASLSKTEAIFWLVIATGLISVLTTVLSALQVFLRYAERSADHRRSAVAYESIRHSIDLFELEFKGPEKAEEALKKLEDISAKVDATVAAAPTIPNQTYRSVEKQFHPHASRPTA